MNDPMIYSSVPNGSASANGPASLDPEIDLEGAEEVRRRMATIRVPLEGTVSSPGRAVDLMVTAWKSEGRKGCRDVMIVAFLPGQRRLRLEGISIVASGRAKGQEILQVSRLTRRGDRVFDALPADGEYRFRCPATIGQSRSPFLWHQEPAALAAASYPIDPKLLSQEPILLESTDRRLRMTLRFTERNRLIVAAETQEPALAGANVAFAFTAREDGTVQWREEIVLDPMEDEPDFWEGRWEGDIPLGIPSDFMFEVTSVATEGE